MAYEILSLKNDDYLKVLRRTADCLLDGDIAVLPTETVYGLGVLASNETAVERLCREKNRRVGHALPLAISGGAMLQDYVPLVPDIAKRFAEKFWPGPLTIVIDVNNNEGKFSKWSSKVKNWIFPQSMGGFRSPDNKFLLDLITFINEPLILTSANISGETPSTSIDSAIRSLHQHVDLFVDGGPSQLGNPSTVVKIVENDFSILRSGNVTREMLTQTLYE